MFYEGKLYPVKRATPFIKAAFAEFVREQAESLYNPTACFAAGLTGLSAEDRATALSAFVAGRQHRDYPEVYTLAAQNTLESARFLVRHLIPEFTEEVTEANKQYILHRIELRHADNEKAGILEILDARRWEEKQGAINERE